MQLTDKTTNFLKNFATINPNIVFRGEEVVKTIAENKTIIGKATLESYPDKEVGIYDLNEFLGTLTLVDNVDIKFNKDHALIQSSSGRSRIKYFYSEPSILTSPMKEIKMPSEEVRFTLENDTLLKLKKAQSTFRHDHMMVSSADNILEISVVDIESKTSNVFTIDVPGEFEEGIEFKFIFNMNNLKLIEGNYDVTLSKKLISHFKHKSENIEYWIALEKDSIYG